MKIAIRELNKHLTCSLCKGYFRNCHTIPECMHSFCYGCLMEHIYPENKKECLNCPTCQVSLGQKPKSKVGSKVLENMNQNLFQNFLSLVTCNFFRLSMIAIFKASWIKCSHNVAQFLVEVKSTSPIKVVSITDISFHITVLDETRNPPITGEGPTPRDGSMKRHSGTLTDEAVLNALLFLINFMSLLFILCCVYTIHVKLLKF